MHMRFALAAIALTLVTLVPAAAPAQSWEEHRPAGIGFRIEMPGKPKLETQKTKAGNTAYHAVAPARVSGRIQMRESVRPNERSLRAPISPPLVGYLSRRTEPDHSEPTSGSCLNHG
jgi:hypothetical protein